MAINHPTNAVQPSCSALERLLAPRSVAVVGVASAPGSLGGIVLDNLQRFDFGGTIHIVHPSQTEIRGIACVASTGQLPFAVDCVVLAIPVAGVLDAVRGCAARGVGGIVIFSAGFAEASDEGRRLQDEIARIAASAGMVIEGPNCLGFVNYVDGVPLTFAVSEPRPLRGPGIAVVSQSGAMAAVLRAALHSRDLDVAYAVSTGNEAVLTAEDFIAHAIRSCHVRVLAVLVEHIRSPRRFIELVREARSRDIAVVMLHPGHSQAARHSAATHTGAIVGDHAVMRTAVMRAGVLVVDTLEEIVDVAECLLRCPVQPSGGVAVMCESGVFKAMTFDYCEQLRCSLPQPEGAAAQALNAIAPGLIVASNPLDITAQALIDPTLYARVAEHLMADGRCGSLLVTIILSSEQMARRKMPPVLALIRDWAPKRNVVFAMLGEDSPVPPDIVTAVREAGVPFFRSPERALRALSQMTSWRAYRSGSNDAQPSEIARFDLPPGTVPEHAAKALLRKAGLRCPEGRLAKDAQAAVEAADAIGYPVALKLQSRDLSHKSDIGGVLLGLNTADAVRAAWTQLIANVHEAAPAATLDGILVEHMVAPGLELIVGGRNDPEWGPVLMIGLGGVLAEALQDVRLIAADLTPAEIERELMALQGAVLFGEFRGRLKRDIAAAADAVHCIGKFIRSHPRVAELDINPLIVLTEGQGAVAADALIELS